MQPAAPPLDVTSEELEALLEGVREALGEAGYQKLKAAIRTLSYVTQLLDVRRAVAQPASATGEVGDHRGSLSGSCSASFCGSDAELPRALPVRAGSTG